MKIEVVSGHFAEVPEEFGKAWLARREEFEQHKRVEEARARAALSAPDALDVIGGYISLFSSEARLPALLRLICEASDEVFWSALAQEWSSCDATWMLQGHLLKECVRRLAGRPEPDVPELLTVYRGCSRSRVRGMPWTTSREVAAVFARGHRGIGVPDPVIASAVIPKEGVFLVLHGREEAEVLVNPRRLRKLAVVPPRAR